MAFIFLERWYCDPNFMMIEHINFFCEESKFEKTIAYTKHFKDYWRNKS